MVGRVFFQSLIQMDSGPILRSGRTELSHNTWTGWFKSHRPDFCPPRMHIAISTGASPTCVAPTGSEQRKRVR